MKKITYLIPLLLLTAQASRAAHHHRDAPKPTPAELKTQVYAIVTSWSGSTDTLLDSTSLRNLWDARHDERSRNYCSYGYPTDPDVPDVAGASSLASQINHRFKLTNLQFAFAFGSDCHPHRCEDAACIDTVGDLLDSVSRQLAQAE